jgi:hypothetical protein
MKNKKQVGYLVNVRKQAPAPSNGYNKKEQTNELMQ